MGTDGRAQLTAEQRRALETRTVSVALSAGAGCGKTLVLAERFLAALEPGADGSRGAARLDELVAITFTERAAREMRARIRRFCRQRLASADDATLGHWRELVRHIDQARVSTIHAFCANLLRQHPLQAGVHPHFRVLEAPQAETLLYATITDVVGRRLADHDPETLDLAVRFSVDRLPGMVAQLLGHRQEIDFAEWQAADVDGLVDRWHDVWREEVLPRVTGALARSPAARAIRELVAAERPTHPVMAERCALLGQCLAQLPDAADPVGAVREIRDLARVQGGGGAKAWSSPDVFAAFRDAATKLRAAIDKLAERLAFDPQSARPAAEAALALLHLGAEVNTAFAARKAELAALDFDDLILHARQLLGQDELAGRLRLLLVDEFQDTDPVQAQLIERLSAGDVTDGRLFLVGDAKQSIYRFRRADPRVFRRLRQALPEAGRLPLSKNFRSQPAILDFVNALFCDDLGTDYEPLEAHRPQVARLPAIEFLWASGDPAEPVDALEQLRRREADWIARRLRALIDGQEPLVYTPAGPRPAAPGDVALLFRALSDVAYYEDALRRYGLDYYLVGGHAFYAQQEIFDLVNLLRAVARPEDEVSLAGILRSPMFNLDDETLLLLSEHGKGLAAGLFSSRMPAALNAEQTRRVRFARETLTELRAMRLRVPIAGLLQEALDRTGYDAALVAEFLGPRKLANLRKLIDRARSFDQSGQFTLDDFITQLSEFVVRQPEEPLAATQGETSHAVRLMSIHQAKGLEFPVVVVPDLDRLMRSRMATVAFTPRLGPMVKCPNVTGGFELHGLLEAEEDAAELARLLYVAATRAADYLILSGGVARLGEWKGPWTQLLARRFDPLTGQFQATLPAGWSVPQVHVTSSEPSVVQPASHGVRRSLEKIVEQAVAFAGKGAGHVPEHLAPVPPDAQAPRRWSFSRLAGTIHEAGDSSAETLLEDEEPVADRGVDPRGLGTLVHAVMAELDFQQPADVAAMVTRYAAEHVGSDERAVAEACDMLRRLAESPRAKALAASARVYRELEFLLSWPLELDRPRRGIVQGFIDCLYEDPDGHWRLLDYKTNHVDARRLAEAARPYEMQMLLYALAVEQILGRAPEELALCFLRPGQEFFFAWDEAARRRAVELIETAIGGATATTTKAKPTRSKASTQQRRLF
jgi:ATP-dependent helicase/nuclease subunit A